MVHTLLQAYGERHLRARSSGGHPFPGVHRLVLLCVAVVACDGPMPGMREIAPPTPPAFGSLQLYPDSGHPLEPRFVSAVSPTSFVAIDRGTNEVWLFSYADGPSMRRLAVPDLPSRARVVTLGSGPRGVGVLDSRGLLTILDTLKGQPVDTIRIEARPSKHVVGLQGLSDGSWVLLEDQIGVEPTTGTMLDSMLLYRMFEDGRVDLLWRHQRSGGKGASALLTDYLSFSAAGDSLHIGASDPPRIWEYVVGRDTAGREIARLTNPPQRVIPSIALQAVQKMTNRPGLAGMELPTVYPPVARAWPLADGFAVLAGAGEKTFALDRYCGTDFSRTALEGGDVVDVTWLPNVVVVRRQGIDAEYFRLELYSPSQLVNPCPPT